MMHVYSSGPALMSRITRASGRHDDRAVMSLQTVIAVSAAAYTRPVSDRTKHIAIKYNVKRLRVPRRLALAANQMAHYG